MGCNVDKTSLSAFIGAGGSWDPNYSGGSGVTTGEYLVSLVKKIDSYYLWHMTHVGTHIYTGSYNASTTAKQKYFSLASPYTSPIPAELTGSENDESSRVYTFDGKLFVTSEGGIVWYNGSYIRNYGKHYLMCACEFNGSRYVFHAEKDTSDGGNACIATYVYEATGGSLFATAGSIFAFDACEYDGNLYIVGCRKDASDMTADGIGYVAQVTTGGSVSYPVQNQGGVITCCHVWDGKLFYGYGHTNAQIGVFDGSTHSIEKTFSGMGGFGDICEFNGVLFASVFKQGGGMELWTRTTDGTWSCAANTAIFEALGTPGVNSGLKGWVGAMTVVDSKLYLLTNDSTVGRTGPSYLFSIEPKTSGATFDLSSVTWLDENVSSWAQTATLSSVSISGGNISLPFDKTNNWPTLYYDGADMNANPWIFIEKDGVWYGSTWEWFRKGSYTKATTAVAGDHMKHYEVFPEEWVPTSGVTYGFMVSGLARLDKRTVSERSNVVMFTWP